MSKNLKTPFTTEEYITANELGVPASGYHGAKVAAHLRKLGFVRRRKGTNHVWYKLADPMGLELRLKRLEKK